MAPGLRRVILREQSYTPLVNLDARPQRAKTAGKMRSALKKAEQKYAKHHKQDEKETAVELPELGEKMSKQQREHCFALAENGDLEALFRVGWMYEHGMNVPRDQAKAAQYYERAAELGHTSAQYSLALLYSTGLGVERDERLFFHWCHAAAKSKDHAAEYRLGAYYYNGFDGANKTITLAEEWFRKSAKGGNADGQAALGLMLLNKEAFAGIGESARSWLLKAANENSALAQFWLGNMYEHGHGDEVAIDLEEAKGWYQLASANGNDEATSRLADLLPL
jgi:TPR repeat protein